MRGFMMVWGLLGMAVVIGILVVTGTIYYTFNQTPQYTSTAKLVLVPESTYRSEAADGAQKESEIQAESILDKVSGSTIGQDFSPKTYALVLESGTLVKRVSDRLKGQRRIEFMAPFKDAFATTGPLTVEEVLLGHRRVTLVPDSEFIEVEFTHPNPVMAALVANYFADEFINYFVKLDIETTMRFVEDMRIRTEHQRFKVEEIHEELSLASPGAKRNSLKIQHQTQSQLYSEMLRRLQLEMTQVALVEPRMRIVEKASPSARPSSPNIKRNLAFGVGIPLAVVLLLGLVGLIGRVTER